MEQKLNENEGILGFHKDDVAKEVKRASRLVIVHTFSLFLSILLSVHFGILFYRHVFTVNIAVLTLVAVIKDAESHFI